MRILFAILLLCVSGFVHAFNCLNCWDNDNEYTVDGWEKPDTDPDTLVLPGILKNLYSMQEENLPSVQEKLENPENKFTPVIGTVESYRIAAKSYGLDPEKLELYFNKKIDPANCSMEITSIGGIDPEVLHQFSEWSKRFDSTQKELKIKTSDIQRDSYHHLKHGDFTHEIFTQLLLIKIRASALYDSSSKDWIKADTTVYLHLPIIVAPQWVPPKNGTDDAVDMVMNFFHIPGYSTRVFFSDGFSPKITDNEDIRQLKVKPYIYPFQVPENRGPELKEKALRLFKEGRFNEAADAMEEALSAVDSTHPFFTSPFSKEDYAWINLLSGNGIRLTPYDSLKHIEMHPSLNGFSEQTGAEIEEWLTSKKVKKDIKEISDNFSRAFARIKYLQKNSLGFSKEDIIDFADSDIEKIDDVRLKDFLRYDYLSIKKTDYPKGYEKLPANLPYFYFGMGPTLDYPLGKLGSHADPIYGVNFNLGFGKNKLGFEFLIQGYDSRGIGDNRYYSTLFLGIDFHYNLLFTKHFEADAYIGPTLNWTCTTIENWTSSYTEDETTTLFPGLDFGTSIGLYSPYHAIGLRLRAGASTEKNKESLTLKPYIALDIILKAFLI